jgi:very-short-patch-repair endonuclease
MSYKRYTVSCLLCKSEISINNLPGHFSSKACQLSKVKGFCKHCGIKLSNVLDPANHVRWCKSNPNKKQISTIIRICPKCDVEFEVLSTSKQFTCSKECSHKHTEKTKEKLSNIRSKFLLENPDKHPWKKSSKFKSTPCENFKKYLTMNGYEFIEEFSPLIERHYSIDIAFPHLKIGIEINGNQHYDKIGNLNPYYQTRHDLIELSGWHLIEVHYTKCFKDEDIKEILKFDYSKSNLPLENYLLEKPIKLETKSRGVKIIEKYDETWKDIKNNVFNYDIDFSKFGWTIKVANIMGVHNPGKWMKRHHYQFYVENCYKRKSPTK